MMKYLFALLLLANVVFYLWESRHGGAGTANYELKLPPSAGERIVLIAELPAIPKKPEPPKPLVAPEPPSAHEEKPAEPVALVEPAPQPEPSTPGCYWLGPYESEADARKILEALPAELQETQVQRRSADTPKGYWVLYPSGGSMELARVNRQMLMDKGVRDLWIFDKGELQGAISLGLYSQRERADAAAGQFQKQGIAVEVRPRLVRAESPWIRFRWPGDRFELDRLLGEQGTGLQPCR